MLPTHPRWAREKPATRTPHQLGRDQPEKGPPPARGPGEGQPRGAEGVLTPVLTQPTATVPRGAGNRGAGRGPSGARDPAAETEGGTGRGSQPASSHPSDGWATFFFKCKHKSTMRLSNSTPTYLPRRNENVSPQRPGHKCPQQLSPP